MRKFIGIRLQAEFFERVYLKIAYYLNIPTQNQFIIYSFIRAYNKNILTSSDVKTKQNKIFKKCINLKKGSLKKTEPHPTEFLIQLKGNHLGGKK